MDKLTKEEVLHVANLGKLELSEEEITRYSYKLKEILDEIEKINDVSETTSEIMINPLDNECVLSEDKCGIMISTDIGLRNAPNKNDDFIEVRGVFDE